MEQTYKLIFKGSYIAHPYWPAMERVINVEKESGVNRARSEQTRAAALSAYLAKIGMSVAELEALRVKAAQPFYTVADCADFGMAPPINGHDTAEIIIPLHQIYGCLVNAADRASSAIRIAQPEQVRSVLTIAEPIFTGKTTADGVFERFVLPTDGTGKKLSNQRALRRNPYISGFSGELGISFDDSLVDRKKIRDFLVFAGRDVGIGASRKIGYGRFMIG